MKLFSIIFFFSWVSFSQINITGKIKDANGSTIEFANVILTDQDSKIIIGTITNKNGFFNITSKKGIYFLKVSFIGYKNYSKEITVNNDIIIKDIILTEDESLLKEVFVNTKKKIIERKADKLIFNVANSHLKTGYDGIEVLKRVPSVFVDGNAIMIRNENAIILVNGRRIKLKGDDLANYISSIDASNIKRIEVQNMASSENDANINGGIINFILKKKVLGFKESFKAYYEQRGEHPKYLGSTNFNYGSEKWNLYGSLYYREGNNSADIKTNTIFTNQDRHYKESTKGTNDPDKALIARFGSTFIPIKNQEIGFEIYAFTKDFGYVNNSNLDIIIDDLILDSGNTISKIFQKRDYYNASMNYTIKLDSLGGSLKLIGDYANQVYQRKLNTNTLYNLNIFEDNTERNKSNTVTDLFTSQLDLKKNIKFLGEVNSGIKITSTNRNSNIVVEKLINEIYEVDTQETSFYNFKENIYAAYFSTANKLTKKIDYKIGLRIENTDLKGVETLDNTSVSKNYIDYFPSLFLLKKMKNKQSLTFSFNRKIKRPRFRVLNPYVTKINDFYFQIGNPNLQPEYRTNIDLSYNFKKSSLSIYNKYTKNLMLEAFFLIDDVTYYQFKNDGDNNVLGIDYSFSKDITKKWYFKFNSSFYNQNYNLSNRTHRHNTFSLNVTTDWSFSKNWSANLISNYSTSKLIGNYVIANNFETNLMVQKTFLKKKLKLRFYADDIFNSKRHKDKVEFSDFSVDFYRKKNTQNFTIWALFTIDSKNKVRTKKNKSSNNASKRL